MNALCRHIYKKDVNDGFHSKKKRKQRFSLHSSLINKTHTHTLLHPALWGPLINIMKINNATNNIKSTLNLNLTDIKPFVSCV